MTYTYSLETVKSISKAITALHSKRKAIWESDCYSRRSDYEGVISKHQGKVDDFLLLDLALLSDVYFALVHEFSEHESASIDDLMLAFIEKADREIFNGSGDDPWLQAIKDWCDDFGCLFPTGKDDDVTDWFWGPLYSFVDEVVNSRK